MSSQTADNDQQDVFNHPPMKTILYFTDTPGFGPWKILISSRASSDLRTTCRSDSKSFKIVIKKIRELSNGYFSDDNHEMLEGSGVGVPIFRAKVTGDLRLIYHIDCISERDTWIQAIRIFGIYTLARMDNRLWNSVSYHLSTRCKVHLSRCTFREYSSGARGRVVLPASFPLTPETGLRSRAITPTIPEEHLDEVTSVVMDKFFTVSHELLRSIFVDLDVTPVFEISSTEEKIISHTSSCFVIGRSGTGKTTAILFKMLGIERIWQVHNDTMPKPRQVFVTRSRVLANKVGEYFAQLREYFTFQDLSVQELAEIARDRAQTKGDKELIDANDVPNWYGNLPSRFSLLQDSHFPLFVTFDHLCKLLEEDIMASRGNHGQWLNPEVLQFRSAFPPITYTDFKNDFWPQLPEPWRKGLDSRLVFSEFVGVIKGSEESLSAPHRTLGRDEYIGFSCRSQATFAGQRELIYTLFERYIKWKKLRGGCDPADRTHKILDSLPRAGIEGHEIDFLYVDEVQDNLLIDITLLRTLCQNADGLFWAGDTAQAIAVGSAFTFNLIKAMLFRIEQKYQQAHKVSRHLSPPRVFTLATNYRSHGGIVRCAQSIVQLITTFFPDTIDVLPDEEGLVDGAKPIFFTGIADHSIELQFLNDQGSEKKIEFGARQCIIVRDEEAKSRLSPNVKTGIIMTLYDSKGLEFDDVLLWNFFEDSAVDASNFQVLLNCLEGYSPTFDSIRHVSISQELKSLYVAVTRARKNLWIVDGSEKADPIKAIWTSRNLIEVDTTGANIRKLGAKSTKTDWETEGRSFFTKERYFQAWQCFDQAGLNKETKVARAHHLRELARSQPRTSLQYPDSFRTAARAFVDCASSGTKREGEVYNLNAAQCFVKGDDHKGAANAYFNASNFDLAAHYYRLSGHFEEAIQIIRVHNVSKDVEESILLDARLFYINENRLAKAMEHKLFYSHKDALEFMEHHNLESPRISLLIELGRYMDAGEIHFEKGRQLEAIRLFCRERTNPRSMRRAGEEIMNSLWQYMSFGRARCDQSTQRVVQELLHMARDLRSHASKYMNDEEVEIFNAITDDKTSTLVSMGQNHYGNNKTIALALFCLDNVFSDLSKLRQLNDQGLAEILQAFPTYVKLLKKVFHHGDFYNSVPFQKLFNFTVKPNRTILVKSGTFIHSEIIEEGAVTSQDDRGTIFTVNGFGHLYKRALLSRILSKVTAVIGVLKYRRDMASCPHFKVNFTGGQAGYHLRIRMCLHQIVVVDNLPSLFPQPDIQKLRLDMIYLLYGALRPLDSVLGHISCLETSCLPKAQNGFGVVMRWLKDMSLTLNTSESFLSDASVIAGLSLDISRMNIEGNILKPHLRKRIEEGSQQSIIYQDLLDFLEDDGRYSLVGGIYVIRQVARSKVHFNIDVLCDFAEHICASMGFYSLNAETHTLHDIILSCGPLITVLERFQPDETPRDTTLLEELNCVLMEILEQLGPKRDQRHLSYAGKSIQSHDQYVRETFVARICKCLCLLGYNTFRPDEKLRQLLARIITARRSIKESVSTVIFLYASTHGYQDLLDLLEDYQQSQADDDLVQLHDLVVCPVTTSNIPGVRLVAYKTIDDIIPLLRRTRAAISGGKGTNLTTCPVEGRSSKGPVDAICGNVGSLVSMESH